MILAEFKDIEEKSILVELKKVFNKIYPQVLDKISALSIHLNLAEDISAAADAQLNHEGFSTRTFGTKNGQSYTQFLISGAKGKKSIGSSDTVYEISSLALSEILEINQIGISASFASVTPKGQYFIDSKVNENSTDYKIVRGQLEIMNSMAQKFLIHEQKSAIGLTKIYKLLIGKDYMRLVIKILISGAGVRGLKVLSKASIRINSFLAFDNPQDSSNPRLIKNLGFFTSENQTSQVKSVSKHYGYLLVQMDELFREQITKGKAAANDEKTKTNVNYKNNSNTS